MKEQSGFPIEKSILIVDDDHGTLRLLKGLLITKGFHIETAYDGLDALVKLKQKDFDLVVLDIMMPEINGYDVCYQLRFNKDYRQVPILLVTAREQELDATIGERVNIDYLQKPIHPDILISKVNQLLGMEMK